MNRQHYFEVFHRQLYDQQQNKRYTDAELHVEGKVLHCHRVVLEAASPYFRAMFASGMREAESGIIHLKDLEADTVQQIINYMYRGTCGIAEETIESLVHVSDLFQLPLLKLECESILCESVEVENCIHLFQLANLFNLEALKLVALDLILKHFSEIFKMVEILDLTCEELVEVIKQDNLEVKTENPVFDLVTRWVNHDTTREKHWNELLEYVRLPFCTKLYLSQEVGSNPVLRKEPCVSYLQEATKFQACAMRQHTVWNGRTKPRKLYKMSQKLVVAGGFTGPPFMYSKQSYSLQFEKTRKWTLLKGTRMVKEGRNLCAIPGGVLSMGKKAELFSMDTKQWKEFPSPKEPAQLYVTVYHDNEVYLIGGKRMSDKEVLTRVEVCDLKNPEWRLHSHLPMPLYQFATLSHGKQLFLFGGITTARELSVKVYACDPLQETWEAMEDIPAKIEDPHVVSLNGDIYLIGQRRRENVSAALKFTPDTNTWTMLSPPSLCRFQADATVWYGKIIVSGGSEEIGEEEFATDEIEVYDPDSNTWSVSSLHLPKCLTGHQLLNIPDNSPAKTFTLV